MLGIEITQQALFYGVVFGLIYAVFAAGFVLVYRSTGVLNFAQGEIGAFGVALFAPVPRAATASRTGSRSSSPWRTSALIGMVIELTVVRRLFNVPRLVLLIATVGVAQLLLVPARSACPNIDAGGAVPAARSPVSGSRPTRSSSSAREVLVLIVAPLAILAPRRCS